jgi:hypothetical protein
MKTITVTADPESMAETTLAVSAFFEGEGYGEMMQKALSAAKHAAYTPPPERWIRELSEHLGSMWGAISLGIGVGVSQFLVNKRYPGAVLDSSIVLDALLVGGLLIDRALGSEAAGDINNLGAGTFFPMKDAIPLNNAFERAWRAGWWGVRDDMPLDSLPELKEDKGWAIRRGIAVRTSLELRRAALDRLTATMSDIAMDITAPYLAGSHDADADVLRLIGPKLKDGLLDGMQGEATDICAEELRYTANVAVLKRFDRIKVVVMDDACIDCKRLFADRIFSSDEILENIKTTGGYNRGPRSSWVALPMLHPHDRCRFIPA